MNSQEGGALTPTPRTAKALRSTQGLFRAAAETNGFADFARQLERELQEASQILHTYSEAEDDLAKQNASLLEQVKKLKGALHGCAEERKEVLKGVIQAISMVGSHYDEFCDEDVPEMTNGSPLHQSLTMIRAHLEGTCIGNDGEYMPLDKFDHLLASLETPAVLPPSGVVGEADK